jgi:hypothetical protein
MGRVFFPTYSLNRFGVRDTDQAATLGAVERFPAEPTPRAAMTPTPPILGALPMFINGDGYSYPTPRIPIATWPGIRPPAPQPIIIGPISSAPDLPILPPAAPPSAAPSVSSQPGPTPTVTMPPPPPAAPLAISSGGGTPTPSTPTVVAAPSSGASLVDNLAGWLGRSTTLFNYNVPNALLAGVVILGFAWLSSSGSKRR